MKFVLPILLSVIAAGGPMSARAGTDRTQFIQLKAGWNAVFLEVQPSASKPGEVFANLPVETVSCFFPGRSDAQYLRNPGDSPWREEGWAVWHAPSKPEAFLSNLHEIQAQRAFLIQASAGFDWTVAGEARATVLQWYPNTCTFTGLPVNSTAPPTFAEFFSGSTAHQRIFRLDNGTWKLLRNAATERARSGEAYWIQTDGASTYQGPLRVKLPASGELDFDLTGGARSLDFSNDAASGQTQIKIERIGEALGLQAVTRDLQKLETMRTSIPTALNLGNLAPGQTVNLRLEPQRDNMSAANASILLRVTDGRGTELWVPVRARRTISRAVLLKN